MIYHASSAAVLCVGLGLALKLWAAFGDTVIDLAISAPPTLQLLATGAAVGALSRFAWLVQQKIMQALWTTITVRSSEVDVWEALLAHLVAHDALSSKEMMVKKKKAKRKKWRQRHLDYMLGKNDMELEYLPGDHCNGVVPFKGERIFLTRNPDGAKQTVGWSRQLVQPEVITLRTWGRNPDLLKDFLQAAVATLQDGDGDEINIMTIGNDWPGGWEKAVTKKARALESVVLDGDVQQRMLADAKDFLASAQWYTDAGIPYRRGYLLHGPPGCGKTSFCQALAGALRLDVCMLSLSNKAMSDNDLAAHLRDAPANAIVLLEDVDAVFVGRELSSSSSSSGGGAGKSGGGGVSFSGLLNAIDGAAAQEGRMLFLTTNHLERLDPALIRPGRCDVRQLVNNASRDQMRRLFVRFFKGQESNAALFAAALPEKELSMAKLQGFLLEHKADASGGSAVGAVPELLQQTKPVELERLPTWNHLRRLGLEAFAPLFEFHGFGSKVELDAAHLTAKDCAHWCFDLASDAHAMRRLTLLLEGQADGALLEHYALAELTTVQDAFVAACFSGGGGGGGGGSSSSSNNNSAAQLVVATKKPLAEQQQQQAKALPSLPSRGPSLDRRSNSSSLAQAAGAHDPNQEEGELTRSFVAAVTSAEGKSVISAWQLRWLLQQHAHDPTSAVAAARRVAAPRTTVGAAVAAVRPPEMTAFDFLRRLGLETHADAVEAEGCTTARELVALASKKPEEFLEKKCGIKDCKAVARIVAVGGCKQEDAALTREFQRPDRVTAKRLFDAHFPPPPSTTGAAAAASEEKVSVPSKHAQAKQQAKQQQQQLAWAFAHIVTDELGFGRASLFQIDAHLAKHAATATGDDGGFFFVGAQAALDTAVASLVAVVRTPPPPKPAPPLPTEWVYGWLKEAGLEQHASGFIAAELGTREELVAEPSLEEKDLEDAVGVKKLGHRRQIMRMLKKLRAEL